MRLKSGNNDNVFVVIFLCGCVRYWKDQLMVNLLIIIISTKTKSFSLFLHSVSISIFTYTQYRMCSTQKLQTWFVGLSIGRFVDFSVRPFFLLYFHIKFTLFFPLLPNIILFTQAKVINMDWLLVLIQFSISLYFR